MNEDWPNLSHQSRTKLFDLCISVGVSPDGKWLSDMAIEAIEKLKPKTIEETLDECRKWQLTEEQIKKHEK